MRRSPVRRCQREDLPAGLGIDRLILVQNICSPAHDRMKKNDERSADGKTKQNTAPHRCCADTRCDKRNRYLAMAASRRRLRGSNRSSAA
jgi:hypothetical protein